MNRGHVVVGASMIAIGVSVLVAGAVAFSSGDLALVGLVGCGALLVVLGVALIRDAIRAARVARERGHRPRQDAGGVGDYHFGPTGDAGSAHGSHHRDRGDSGSGGPEPVGGGTGGGDSGGGFSGGDFGGGGGGGGD